MTDYSDTRILSRWAVNWWVVIAVLSARRPTLFVDPVTKTMRPDRLGKAGIGNAFTFLHGETPLKMVARFDAMCRQYDRLRRGAQLCHT